MSNYGDSSWDWIVYKAARPGSQPIQSGRVVYLNKEKASKFSLSTGVQFPKEGALQRSGIKRKDRPGCLRETGSSCPSHGKQPYQRGHPSRKGSPFPAPEQGVPDPRKASGPGLMIELKRFVTQGNAVFRSDSILFLPKTSEKRNPVTLTGIW